MTVKKFILVINLCWSEWKLKYIVFYSKKLSSFLVKKKSAKTCDKEIPQLLTVKYNVF